MTGISNTAPNASIMSRVRSRYADMVSAGTASSPAILSRYVNIGSSTNWWQNSAPPTKNSAENAAKPMPSRRSSL